MCSVFRSELYFESSFFFFFSSRRRHTRLTCDWSSDVCSSDLLGRVVHGGIHGVGVPAIREVALRVDALDQQFQRHMLVARYAEPTPDRLALGKRALEFDPEPGAKLCRVREGAPHAGTWGAEYDAFFDPIGAHRVLGRWGLDCHGLTPRNRVKSRSRYATFVLRIIAVTRLKCNPHVALSAAGLDLRCRFRRG